MRSLAAMRGTIMPDTTTRAQEAKCGRPCKGLYGADTLCERRPRGHPGPCAPAVLMHQAERATLPHHCEFPVLPPHSLADPGPCECGKTYLAQIAEQRAAEAGLVVVDPEDLRMLMRLAEDYAGRDPLHLPPSDSCREALDRLAVAAGVKP